MSDHSQTRLQEFEAKRERLTAFMDEHRLAGILLVNRSNTAWLGAGPADGVPFEHIQGSRTEIWHQSDTGVASFVVTPTAVHLVTENIELPRLTRDEFSGLPIEVLAQPWHESGACAACGQIIGKGRVAVDTLSTDHAHELAAEGLEPLAMTEEITELRAELLPREIERYRWLGRVSAEVMTDVCHWITEGVKEAEVVAEAQHRLHRMGIAQEVNIVCSDGRLNHDRHGLYGDYSIRQRSMVVFCAHKWGLVANLTRMVELGDDVPPETAAQHEALASFDAEIMRATVPGASLSGIFTDVIIPGYAKLGQPDAWKDHHQGGSTGYSGRDKRVTPTTAGAVQRNQAFAWNPSLPALKSEDTFIATDDGPEVITVDERWPVYESNGRPRIVPLGRA